ncbi:MAG TPA: hypothetical protein VGB75_19550 [Jatrophihabitans sp.]|jgi:hypothetical protein|uniref:hypothetical protein n=1 Tax=Jatrophihabitans sp. TaxID=1932789 RepID=UPI002EF71057
MGIGGDMWYWLWWVPPAAPVVLILGWAVTAGRKRGGVGRSYNIDAQREATVSQVAYSASEAALPMRDRSFEKPRNRTHY